MRLFGHACAPESLRVAPEAASLVEKGAAVFAEKAGKLCRPAKVLAEVATEKILAEAAAVHVERQSWEWVKKSSEARDVPIVPGDGDIKCNCGDVAELKICNLAKLQETVGAACWGQKA